MIVVINILHRQHPIISQNTDKITTDTRKGEEYKALGSNNEHLYNAIVTAR